MLLFRSPKKAVAPIPEAHDDEESEGIEMESSKQLSVPSRPVTERVPSPKMASFSIAPDSDNEEATDKELVLGGKSRRQSVDSFWESQTEEKKVTFPAYYTSGASSFAEDSKDEDGGKEHGEDDRVKKKRKKK